MVLYSIGANHDQVDQWSEAPMFTGSPSTPVYEGVSIPCSLARDPRDVYEHSELSRAGGGYDTHGRYDCRRCARDVTGTQVQRTGKQSYTRQDPGP